MATKLQQLIELYGYSDADALIAAALSARLILGICMNRRCNYVIEVEKDQKYGYCELCGTETVKSATILAKAPGRIHPPVAQTGSFALTRPAETNCQLSDRELVQFVTGAGATEAHTLLRKFGGASAVIAASESEMAAKGIDDTTAHRIRAFQEAAAAHHWRKVTKRTALSSWNELLDYCLLLLSLLADLGLVDL